ncbi:GNAT family N-acetyltransferase [Streptomyces sp. enrichment culture]|uniref:GNAT family N-acetyltransferase n=1 Tax=Streptomyces sp. enrichment culture TaxID=1795815 RepID=UPI003F54F6A1
MRIRPAAPGDLPALQEIERAAGAPFRDLGMPEVADDAPPALDTLERHRRAHRCWVAVEDGREDRPVAYLIAEPVDGALHVEQVSVHPAAARRGVGGALLARAADRARADGLTALTLTTFAEVPWNAPYYARLGFRTLSEAELTPGLRRIRAEEAAHGLDRWPRVCMRAAVPPAGRSGAELPERRPDAQAPPGPEPGSRQDHRRRVR